MIECKYILNVVEFSTISTIKVVLYGLLFFNELTNVHKVEKMSQIETFYTSKTSSCVACINGYLGA